MQRSPESKPNRAEAHPTGIPKLDLHFDTIEPLDHIPLMRLTINLDDDLYATAHSHAIAAETLLSKAVEGLLRRRTASPVPIFQEFSDADCFLDPVLP